LKPLEVVYFAIEDNSQGAIRGRHRLVTTSYIDDAQTAVTKMDITLMEVPEIIWPTMPETVCHLHDEIIVFKILISAYTTH
jgi:hypothetical protein